MPRITFTSVSAPHLEVKSPTASKCSTFSADVKPDNILINCTCDDNGNKTVTDVALGDFDIAFKLEPGLLLRYAIGNVMWRSLEGQTASGVTKASDIYSFGLVVSER